MQHLLMRMWTEASEGIGPIVLTRELCNRLGGIENALSNHADEALEEADHADLGKVAEALFKCLGTRSPGKKTLETPPL